MALLTRIDRASRRREVARAAWRVIQRKGLDRCGIRDIAEELGGTASTATHYFRTRDELIQFACEEVFSAYRTRLANVSPPEPNLESLEEILLAGLPVKPGREIGWEVWIAFLGHAIGRPAAKALEGRRENGLREILEARLTELRDRGTISADKDLSLEADLLAALIDGLGIGRIFQPERYTGERIAELLRSHLQQRFGYQAK